MTLGILSLRTDFAKRVEHPGLPAWSQVFDLRVDPLGMGNRSQDLSAAARRGKLRARLAAADVRRVSPEGVR